MEANYDQNKKSSTEYQKVNIFLIDLLQQAYPNDDEFKANVLDAAPRYSKYIQNVVKKMANDAEITKSSQEILKHLKKLSQDGSSDDEDNRDNKIQIHESQNQEFEIGNCVTGTSSQYDRGGNIKVPPKILDAPKSRGILKTNYEEEEQKMSQNDDDDASLVLCILSSYTITNNINTSYTITNIVISYTITNIVTSHPIQSPVISSKTKEKKFAAKTNPNGANLFKRNQPFSLITKQTASKKTEIKYRGDKWYFVQDAFWFATFTVNEKKMTKPKLRKCFEICHQGLYENEGMIYDYLKENDNDQSRRNAGKYLIQNREMIKSYICKRLYEEKNIKATTVHRSDVKLPLVTSWIKANCDDIDIDESEEEDEDNDNTMINKAKDEDEEDEDGEDTDDDSMSDIE